MALQFNADLRLLNGLLTVTFCTFFTANNVFYRQKNPEESNPEIEGGGAGNGSLFSYPTIRQLPVQKGTNTTGEVR
jgi:hypothetical protein